MNEKEMRVKIKRYWMLKKWEKPELIKNKQDNNYNIVVKSWVITKEFREDFFKESVVDDKIENDIYIFKKREVSIEKFKIKY